MADLSYSIDVNTRQATASIAALKNSLTGLAGAFTSAFAVDKVVGIAAQFEQLRVSLGILYKDTAAGAQAFDRIKTLAANSVFSVDDLTNTFIKLKSSGIEPTDEQLRLFADVSSVAADSVGALQAITDLYARTTAGGLGLEDLNRLADRGIPVFNILARTMGLSRLEVSKFGQSADGAQKILKVLEVELGKTFGGASAARANTLAQAMANVSDSFKNLIDRVSQAGPGNALTDTLKNLADFINGINIQQINNIIENVKNLVLAFAGLAIIGKIGPMIVNLGLALTRTAPGAASLSASLAASSPAFAAFSSGLKMMMRELEMLPHTFNRALGGGPVGSHDKGLKMLANSFFFLGGQILKMLPLIGQLIIAFEILDATLTLLTGKNVAGWFDETALSLERFVTNNFPKLAAAINSLGEMLGMAPPPSVAAENQAEIDRLKKRADAAAKSRVATQENSKAIVEQNFALDRLRVSYAMLGIEAARYTQQLRLRLGFEAGIIGMSEDQVELETKLREEAERFQRRIEELQDKQIQLRTNLIGEKDTKKVAEYNLEIELIAKLIKDTSDAHLQNRDAIIKGVEAIQTARLLEADRKNNIDRITAAYERQYDITDKISQALKSANDILDEERFKARRFGSEYERAVANIFRTNRKAAEDAAKALLDTFNLDEALPPAEAARLERGLQQITDAFGNVTKQQVDNLDYSRTWVAGWEEAFQKYVDNAGNAARQAASYFDIFTKGLEDAIVRFVQTGKLSFKDLANNIIAEFVRIQVRSQVMNVLGGGGFFGKLFGGIGFGTGLGFGSMDYGGFFAKGGTLGAGKWGIAGEAGPEIVSGPATITPMTQMPSTTTINYNINAVDAVSFRAMVARDPEFIYQVTEAGRRSQPQRRLS